MLIVCYYFSETRKDCIFSVREQDRERENKRERKKEREREREKERNREIFLNLQI